MQVIISIVNNFYQSKTGRMIRPESKLKIIKYIYLAFKKLFNLENMTFSKILWQIDGIEIGR